ncbi:MAG: sugar ABC transporter permease [Clostridia bacterium]|nr:sugar ABC transporter permease [Clostridia bacterium]
MRQTTSKLTSRKNRIGYLFILPFVIGLVCIFLPCLAKSLIYSFNEITSGKGGWTLEFVGWDNYYRLFFVDVQFREQLLNALKGIFVDTLMIMVFSFFVANVLNQKFLGRGAARAILFLPVILSTGVISAVQYNDMSMGLFGNAANGINSGIGGSSVDLEALIVLVAADLSPKIVTFLVDSVNNTTEIINSSGVQILVFMAALQSIPQSVFEAAKVEGATPWQEFWKITFPMVTPMLLVNLVYTIVDTFTRPSYGILEMVNTQAFNNDNMGFASAISWAFFLLMALVLALVVGIVSRYIQYND